MFFYNAMPHVLLLLILTFASIQAELGIPAINTTDISTTIDQNVEIIQNRIRTKMYWKYIVTHTFMPEPHEVPPEQKDNLQVVQEMRWNFEEHEVIREVIFKEPLTFCKVVFPVDRGGQMVNYSALNGNIVPKHILQNKPFISWIHDMYTYYTLIYVCPDCPMVGNNSLVWMVTNIRNGNISNGTLIAKYKPPQWDKPMRRRHVFLIYDQGSGLIFPEHLNESKQRINFTTERFTCKYRLKDAFAGNFMMTKD